jgi:DNA-binding transcriptional MerR regulator
VDGVTAGWVRIGELSRRVGVSDHVLRAWERRYGLLSPVRTESGYRLYSEDDERRIMRMRALLAKGLSAAAAARAARAEVPTVADGDPTGSPGDGVPRTSGTAGGRDPADRRLRLARALESLDQGRAHAALDELFGELIVEEAVRDVVMPYLHDLGERWGRGDITVAQEHFASQALRARLSGLGPDWGRGRGPSAILACPPGERHDLALLAFGVVLGRRGWAVTFLGAETPLDAIAAAVVQIVPDIVVLAATAEDRFASVRAEVADLAARWHVLVAGAGATEAFAREVGATLLSGDPVSAAERLAR